MNKQTSKKNVYAFKFEWFVIVLAKNHSIFGIRFGISGNSICILRDQKLSEILMEVSCLFCKLLWSLILRTNELMYINVCVKSNSVALKQN